VCFRWIRVSMPWTEETAIILFVWVTFIGASLALKRGEHFAVEVLRRNIPFFAAWIVSIVVALILIFFSLLLLIYGYELVVKNLEVVTPTMEISRGVPYSSVLVGAALMLIRSLEIFWRNLRGQGVPS
jgi:TRAP-type C4-dicarboxylate transport system permease small subunit